MRQPRAPSGSETAVFGFLATGASGVNPVEAFGGASFCLPILPKDSTP